MRTPNKEHIWKHTKEGFWYLQNTPWGVFCNKGYGDYSMSVGQCGVPDLEAKTLEEALSIVEELVEED